MNRPVLLLVVLWVTAANLRTAIFAIQPVLPDIRHDLGLSFSTAGGLTSMAIALLGAGSIPGAYIGYRLGARRTVWVMAAGMAVASLLRLLPPATAWIFLGTAGLALCASFAQPAAAVLVRRWFGDRLHRATGVYSNGILIGGTVGASTTPLMAALSGWRSTFVIWAVVALLTAALWMLVMPRSDAPMPRLRLGEALRSRRAAQITALFAFQNLAYFCTAAWLPFLLEGRSAGYVAWVFTCLNLLPVFPLLLLPALRWAYATSAAYYSACGLAVIVGAAGLALGLRDAAWVLAFLVGFGCAAAFVGAIALPAVVARSEQEAAAITTVVFTFGYVLAFSSPVIAGLLVDGTHHVALAFLPSLGGGVLMLVLGILVPGLLAQTRREMATT